ncbi:MAG: hypothetical protein ABJE47_15840 [bacterium]
MPPPRVYRRLVAGIALGCVAILVTLVVRRATHVVALRPAHAMPAITYTSVSGNASHHKKWSANHHRVLQPGLQSL